MSRKGMFQNLPVPGSVAPEPSSQEEPLPSRAFAFLGVSDPDLSKPKGVVGALSQVIDENAARSRKAIERAEIIEKQLTEGHTIIEIDPALVDPSFIRDRMEEDDASTLRDAIRDHGQQVPILVRPHPKHPDRYQAAYGHRRLRVIAELGRKIRAVVLDLSDDQLIIAQGQENNERRNLSFIEKCRFAAALEQRSFKRNVITAALGVNKSHLSEMLSIIEKIPAEVIDAIGSAPKHGRRTWMELCDNLGTDSSVHHILEIVKTTEFANIESDERLRRILSPSMRNGSQQSAVPLRSVPQSRTIEKWTTNQGKALAKVRCDEKQIFIMLSRSVDSAFADEALAHLKTLYERTMSENSSRVS